MTIDVIGIGAAPGDNTGDGLRTAMTKVNNNFGSPANSASKLVGTATGQIPTADDLLVVGETNYSTGNLNQLVFGGIAGARFGSGIATNTTTVTMNLPMNLFGDITSAAFVGLFRIVNPLEFTFGEVDILNINFDAAASTGRCLCFTVGGLSGLTARDPVTIECVNSTSKITVTV
ncbi:MAG: hypothetical protein V7771_19015 [Shewanella psychromarinicola]|uniref:hypothetical protein n=1 Tax=Shewanella psychromarinicola TaxID=2487742 RepID=UPI0030023FE5